MLNPGGGGGGGGLFNEVVYGEASPQGPTPHSQYINYFDWELSLSIDKWYPCIYFKLLLVHHLFIYVNKLLNQEVFLFHSHKMRLLDLKVLLQAEMADLPNLSYTLTKNETPTLS